MNKIKKIRVFVLFVIFVKNQMGNEYKADFNNRTRNN